RKRLLFITVKDNTQKSKWISIGKINDWIRRYSTTYTIVRGTEGGSHFHMLAGVKPNSDLKCQKGIHFHIKNLLTDKIPYTRDDEQYRRDAEDLKLHILDDRITLTQYQLTLEQQHQLSQICKSVLKHFKTKTDKIKTADKKTKKQKDIQSVLDYLTKNLNEPRDGEVELYRDYINIG
uniref:hypothetical protein n=1 Tax=Polynucleobacter sp. TaxID=2029855 RepID=UPI004047D844